MPLLIVSDPSTGKSQKVELEDARMTPLFGKKIGEVVDGAVANMAGYKLKITGGTDKDGVPMRPDIHGSAKSHIIFSGGVGFHPKAEGERRRKVIRGNTIGPESKFINMAVVGQPKGKKKAENKTEEAAAEKPADEKKD
ncbi:TPA: 30S ribosomal protein S6e [Candidatus Bathyarchaeota archaeon]|nr:30S ribosomal protein S6e [Candidatus Bathyarchaeota archaeon]